MSNGRKERVSRTLRGRSLDVIAAGDPSLLEGCSVSLGGNRTLLVTPESAPAVIAAWDAGWESYRETMRQEVAAATAAGDTTAASRVRSADAALRGTRAKLGEHFGC